MSIIEKINSVIKFIRNILSKTFDFIVKIKDILWLTIVVVISLFLISQCKSNDKLERNVEILNNNTYALTDSIRHYHDKLGNVVAEKHALQLTQEQMEVTIGKLKEKNAEYVAYINTNIVLKDSIYTEKIVYRDVVVDTTKNIEKGTINLEKNDIFNKSRRFISANIPYSATYPSNLIINNASFIVEQDIFVESTITKNNKTKETMIYLKSDYPGLTFNNGNGIIAINSKQYEKDMRKRNGIGLAIGPSIGIFYDNKSKSLKPSIGLSLTIGYTFTPKSFQW
jgi:light-regulated signal transduction histidine kinase (bacteriophytochrome)